MGSGQIGGAILGIGLQAMNNGRQINQQRELTQIQSAAQKDLTDYNQEKAYQMWQKTNYDAQVEQLKKAGLNAGLLYGMGGSGGATANVTAGSVTGGQAPQGGREVQDLMGIGLQAELLKAQKENIEADTANKLADAKNKPKVGENLDANTQSILQGINNQKAIEELTKWQASLEQVKTNLANATFEQQTEIVNTQLAQFKQMLRSATVRANVDEKTEDTMIENATAELVKTRIEAALFRSEINVNTQQIKNMKEEINKWAVELTQGYYRLANEKRNSYSEQANAVTNYLKMKIEEKMKEWEQSHPTWDKAVTGSISGLGEVIDNIFKSMPRF